VRVVAGQWRGRRLSAPPGQATRPTTDRVKEALFSILGGAVDGARVVDLCCGSGGLGIEALSRGAAFVEFVDHSWQALDAVGRNLASCGAADETYRLLRRDVLGWLADESAAGGHRDLILADPPYAGELAPDIWRAFCRLAAGGLCTRAVLEHAPALDLDDPPAGWRVDRRRYGAASLSIMEKDDE